MQNNTIECSLNIHTVTKEKNNNKKRKYPDNIQI